MAKSIVSGDFVWSGSHEFSNSVNLPAGSVVNADVAAAAAIGAEKQQHQYALVYTQAVGTAIVAEERIIHIARGAGTILDIEATIETSATGADRTVTVDLEKGDSSTAFATVLSTTVNIVDATADRELVAGTINGALNTYTDGQYLNIKVTVAGAAGAQAQGLCVRVFVREAAD